MLVFFISRLKVSRARSERRGFFLGADFWDVLHSTTAPPINHNKRNGLSLPLSAAEKTRTARRTQTRAVRGPKTARASARAVGECRALFGRPRPDLDGKTYDDGCTSLTPRRRTRERHQISGGAHCRRSCGSPTTSATRSRTPPKDARTRRHPRTNKRRRNPRGKTPEKSRAPNSPGAPTKQTPPDGGTNGRGVTGEFPARRGYLIRRSRRGKPQKTTRKNATPDHGRKGEDARGGKATGQAQPQRTRRRTQRPARNEQGKGRRSKNATTRTRRTRAAPGAHRRRTNDPHKQGKQPQRGAFADRAGDCGSRSCETPSGWLIGWYRSSRRDNPEIRAQEKTAPL